MPESKQMVTKIIVINFKYFQMSHVCSVTKSQWPYDLDAHSFGLLNTGIANLNPA